MYNTRDSLLSTHTPATFTSRKIFIWLHALLHTVASIARGPKAESRVRAEQWLKWPCGGSGAVGISGIWHIVCINTFSLTSGLKPE